MENNTILIQSSQITLGSSKRGVLKIPERLKGDYCLEYFTFIHSIHNITSSNNKLNVNGNEITVTPGQYEEEDLASYLDSELKDLNPNYEVIFNPIQHTFTFSLTDTFTLNFNISNSIASVLGFSETEYSGAESYTGNFADVFVNKFILIKVIDNNANNIHGSPNIVTSFYIPLDNEFGKVIHYKPKFYPEQKINLNNINEIELEFRDHEQKIISLTTHWYMFLRKKK